MTKLSDSEDLKGWLDRYIELMGSRDDSRDELVLWLTPKQIKLLNSVGIRRWYRGHEIRAVDGEKARFK